MSHLDDRLARDIGLWLAGESVDAAADRAVTALATRPEARGATGAARSGDGHRGLLQG